MRTKIFDIIFLVVFSGVVFSQNVIIDGVPRDTSFTLYQTFIKERKARPYIQPVYAQLPENEISFENLVYKNFPTTKQRKTRQLHLNIYRPNDGKKYPALLMIHGGGWNSGNLTLEIPLAQHIAQKGYVTVPVEYRLIPEALYPAGENDLKDAIVWLHQNAEKYGIDESKIAVSGTSAGGQLACLLGTKNESGFIKAVVNIDGLSTFIDTTIVNRAQKARESKAKMPVDATWLGGTFSENPKNWKSASAYYFVSKKSSPVCFINSSIPRFHAGRDEIMAKLNQLGIYTEVHTFPDTPHPFWFFEPWHQSTVDIAVGFLDKVLKK